MGRGGKLITVVLAAAVAAAACSGGEPSDDTLSEEPAAEAGDDVGPDTAGEASQDQGGRAEVDTVELVVKWVDTAAGAARNGAEAVIRFATVTRHPDADGDDGCLPPFVEQLLEDPDMFTEAQVTRLDDGRYRIDVAGTDVEVAVLSGRVLHMQGCGGPDELFAQAAEDAQQRAEETAAATAAPPPAPSPSPPPAPSPSPSPSPAPSPSTHTLRGTMFVVPAMFLDRDGDRPREGARCSGSRGYEDLTGGAQVVVRDQAGTIVGSSRLDDGGIVLLGGDLPACILPFTVPGVATSTHYTVEVSHRGGVTYSHDDLVRSDWFVELTVG